MTEKSTPRARIASALRKIARPIHVVSERAGARYLHWIPVEDLP